MRIYLPMTCNILVKGHLRCIEKLLIKGDVVVGLLTREALKGYKEELVPFKDRKYILEALKYPIWVVPQKSLDPYKNLKEYTCDAIASGDGFEPVEIQAGKKLKLKFINIKSGEKIHGSDIWKPKKKNK